MTSKKVVILLLVLGLSLFNGYLYQRDQLRNHLGVGSQNKLNGEVVCGASGSLGYPYTFYHRDYDPNKLFSPKTDIFGEYCFDIKIPFELVDKQIFLLDVFIMALITFIAFTLFYYILLRNIQFHPTSQKIFKSVILGILWAFSSWAVFAFNIIQSASWGFLIFIYSISSITIYLPHTITNGLWSYLHVPIDQNTFALLSFIPASLIVYLFIEVRSRSSK